MEEPARWKRTRQDLDCGQDARTTAGETPALRRTEIEAEDKRKAALQALFKTMLHHLMTGKIRVRG